MPKMNGRDTLVRIREMDRFRDIPIVLFTTSSAENDKHFAHKHNAGFITKPLNNRQMKLITDQFIQHCTDDVKRSLGKA
jgi:CheY-like chemotaxis protein